MRSNVKPRRQNDQIARSDPELPHINQKYNRPPQPQSLTPTNNHENQYSSEQNSMTSLNNKNQNYNRFNLFLT